MSPPLRRGFHWFDRRNHSKMVIIDGEMASLGGFNIGDEYSGLAQSEQRFRDVGLSISGGALGELVRNFSEIWRMERGEPPRPSSNRRGTGNRTPGGRAGRMS